jgi:HEPN domain-containing protein
MHYPTPDEIICYHCQQSAEKYLKAFLFSCDIETDKTHDLKDLLKIKEKHNPDFSSLHSNAYILTGYAVLPRYPNELGISNEDMKTALVNAKSIQEFVMKIFDGAV